MAIRPLKELDDYELANSGQDCRGWPVIDAAGNRIGTVTEMLVDTDAERVSSLVLDKGQTIPAGSVSLRDGKVHARTTAAGTATTGTTGTTATTGTATPATGTTARPGTTVEAGKEVVLPVVEEEIRVGKRQVPAGGVRVSTKVEERPVHEKVTLREEHVNVKRQPADRAVASGREAFEERSFEVPAKAEEPVVDKQARVVEEVIVGKDVRERDAVIDDKVKRTDVDVTDKTTGKEPRRS